MKKRVLVGMSGGVDSSVACLILQQKGYEVFGVFMKNWSAALPGGGECNWRDDRFDARSVAVELDIPLLTRDFEDAYTTRVLQPFLSEYENGRTPNPDILCNREIKFPELTNVAAEIGAEYIATGHYARIGDSRGKNVILKARDTSKDQSYFLSALTSCDLQHVLFPIGEYTKKEVREMAKKYHLPTAEKKDSQGLCFVGNVDMQTFLKQYIPPKHGRVIDEQGKTLAEHDGQAYYTIGQRHGLKQGSGVPFYVTARDPQENTVTVVTGRQHALLFNRVLYATNVVWTTGVPPSSSQLTAKIRYRQDDQIVRCIKTEGSRFRVEFAEPQRAITPGQAVVFYNGDEMLGGGTIDSASQNTYTTSI